MSTATKIPDAVILVIQDQIRVLRDRLEKETEAVEEIKGRYESELSRAESKRLQTETYVQQMAAFLSEYNSEAHPDWFAELEILRDDKLVNSPL